MKNVINFKGFASLLLVSLFLSCTEPYALQTSSFDNVVVIEATLTNEMKPQVIKVSRTYRFEEDGPVFEAGANVYVQDDAGVTYDFAEQGGQYVSAPFQAIAGKHYVLHVTTSDGTAYVSTSEKLPTQTALDEITATQVTQNSVPGIQLEANAFDATATSKYYRYEYEETYKIVAPLWSPLKVEIIDNPLSNIDFFNVVPRQEETKTCFVTAKSTGILVASTNDLAEDRISHFPVRFINVHDPMLRERYSILIRQYVQNLAAFTYYSTLRDLSVSGGNILSQNQPGFFYGNLKVAGRPNDKVIGFFDVSSVSEKRVFYNYHDLFPGEPVPDYPYTCNIQEFDASITEGANCYRGYCGLFANIQTNLLVYYNSNYPIFQMVPRECGDCTSLGSNITPSFWQD